MSGHAARGGPSCTWRVVPILWPMLVATALFGASADPFRRACGATACVTMANLATRRSAFVQRCAHDVLVGALVYGCTGPVTAVVRAYVLGVIVAMIATRSIYDRCVFLPWQRARESRVDASAWALLAAGGARALGWLPGVPHAWVLGCAIGGLSHFYEERPATRQFRAPRGTAGVQAARAAAVGDLRKKDMWS